MRLCKVRQTPNGWHVRYEPKQGEVKRRLFETYEEAMNSIPKGAAVTVMGQIPDRRGLERVAPSQRGTLRRFMDRMFG